MNEFDKFLNHKNYQNSILQNAKLKEVKVNKFGEWTLYIELTDFIDARLLFTFTKNLKEYLSNELVPNIDIKYLHINKSNFEKEALSYFENTIYYLSEKTSDIVSLKEYKVSFENNTFNIHIDEDSKWISDYFNDIKKTFLDIDVEPEIKYIVDESIKSLSEVIEDRVNNRTEMLKEIESVKEVEVVETRKFHYSRQPIEIELAKIPVDQFGIHKFQNDYGIAPLKVTGEVSEIELRPTANSNLMQMTIFDNHDAIIVKSWVNKPADMDFIKSIKPGEFVQVIGEVSYDTWAKDVSIMTRDISKVKGIKQKVKEDRAKNKRIELHLHTKMSDMDGVTDVKDYVNRAISYGHKAIAFTDHNGVYAFPDIYNATKGKDIKPIYGVEFDLVDSEKFKVITEPKEDLDLLEETYVVFDLETTGLSATHDTIIEIGAVKIRNGQVEAKYQTFVNPNRKVSEFIKKFTNISDDDLNNARMINEVIPEFIEFIGDAILVAHNANFDMGFLYKYANKFNLKVNNLVVDTLNVARYFYQDKMKRFNLKALSRYFKVELENHHRADEDANATSQVWLKMIYDLREQKIKTTFDLYNAIKKEEAFKHVYPEHVTILVKNQEGYKDLFKLVSLSLTDNFYNGARTLKKDLIKYRKHLLIGSACSQGEVFETALNGSDEKLIEVMAFYDYIEVQPPSAYNHIIEQFDENGYEIVTGTISKIINTAKRLNKLVVATGNVHYLDDEDEIYRKIFVRTPLVGGGFHPLSRAENLPKQYFRTTNEMLNEFSFLTKPLAEEIVITNTNLINDKIEYVKGFPDELFSLPDDAFVHIGVKSVAKETENLVNLAVKTRYGDNPHGIIKDRVKKELDSIIGNKFASIYYISHLLVKKSLEDGYLVGSRGSVGSSFVATLMDITEVNPLKPHYRCKEGHFTVFGLSQDEVYQYGMTEVEKDYQKYFKDIQSGFDLPDANCPICNMPLLKDGHDIPFETFLGFKGDKVPDIDLNFSGEYQSVAHDYVKELLGEDHSFRAGTISTVADKVAYGYVMGYLEDNELNYRKAKINLMAKKILGVKRSTGQHPGGIVVVPKDKTIYDVTPIQFPANNTESSWYTTHFDYHSFEDNLLKLDILGHDDPTIIKFIMDRAKRNIEKYPFKDASDIPLADPNVLKMFRDTMSIGIKPEDVFSDVASFGIPEFGTPFTREMLNNTKPDSFAGLVKISGLSHGTGVWLKNSQDLINGTTEYGKISFNDIIACRDDIMVQLSEMGLKEENAFEIMEFVRRGRPLKMPEKWNTYVEEMEKHNVPDWYIWSASQIQYMFPKAHAAAYVIMALRIAWFKYYDPLLFYSAFFSKKASQFDYEIMISGVNALKNKLRQLAEIPAFEKKVKDNDLQVALGVALEMSLRGYKFLPVDINKSLADEFLIEKEGLRMPFITIEGLGGQAAERIVQEREITPFKSIEDVIRRTRINKNVQGFLNEYGSFGDLKDEDEIINVGLFANS